MEWDLKLPPWDFAELGRDAEPAVESIGSLGHHMRGQDCSVDLKLGGLGEFGSPDKWKDQPRVPNVMVSSSNTSKRARGPSSGSTVSCLVDGCMADLSKCREYHRRHKVCEVHSKTPIVMVDGREQRFCQQCSRFHLLVEFDEVKRSCRKRLDGHNRRRRKPQPDFIHAGSLITGHQGTRFSYYPQIFPTGTQEPNWTRIIKSEEDALYTHRLPLHLFDRQQHLPGSSSSYKGKQFPFLQDGDAAFSSRTMLGTSLCQPELKTITFSGSSSSKMFSDGITHVPNSDCALSLLSSSSQTSAINLSQMVPADGIPMGQPHVSGTQYGGLGRYSRSQASETVSPTGFSYSGMENGHTGAVLVPTASDADLHCQGIFHIAGEGASDDTSQALPFSWQ